MKFIAQLIIPLASLWFTQGFANEDTLIVNLTLHDGTQVKGELLSLDQGVFSVKTKSLGNIKIPESEIASMQSGQSPITQPPPSADIESIQQNIMSNPDAMKQIMALQQDPQFMKILQNPDIMKAVQSGNIDVLSNHAEFKKLMGNKKIKKLLDDYK